MSLQYLLDTNTISDLIRHPQGPVARRIGEVGEDAVCTSIVVSSEVRFGVEKSGSEKLRSQAEAILSAMAVLPFDLPADQHYAELRWHLTRRGAPIGPNDLLIAAHARALDLAVVTANDSEFRRVPSLEVENWLGDRPEGTV